MHPVLSSGEQNTFSDLELNLGEQLEFEITLHSPWHFFANDMFGIFFCFLGEHFLVHKLLEFSWICGPFVQSKI